MESSILSSVSLEAGLAAIQQERHQDAIGILEAFCHDCAANAQWTDRSYLQAQMHLIQTYAQNAQPERAIVLCERLAASDNAQVKIWAQQALKSLMAVQTIPEATHKSAQENQTAHFDVKVLNPLRLLFRKAA